MNVRQCIDRTSKDKTLLIGYYGGGNYGDELLLEVLANLYGDDGAKRLTVAYQDASNLDTFHRPMGYVTFPMADKKRMLSNVAATKNIVIGGGGLWGLDMNTNIFLLSVMLFVSRLLLRKKVYLLGNGYYSSTSRLGHIAAWFAGKAANHIVARDQETYDNFRKITKHVSLDRDIAWQLPDIDPAPYSEELEALKERFALGDKALFITLRRFRPNQKNDYLTTIEQVIAQNTDKRIIVSLMEPREVDPQGYDLIKQWEEKYSNLKAWDFSYNPVALYLFFRQYRQHMAVIAPQFHLIITAALSDIPFLPVAYDNKVTELLKQLDSKQAIDIKQLTPKQVQEFIDSTYAR